MSSSEASSCLFVCEVKCSCVCLFVCLFVCLVGCLFACCLCLFVCLYFVCFDVVSLVFLFFVCLSEDCSWESCVKWSEEDSDGGLSDCLFVRLIV